MDQTTRPASGPIRVGGWASFGFWIIALGGLAASASVAAGVEAARRLAPYILPAEALTMLIVVTLATLGARGHGLVFRLMGFVLFALWAAVIVFLANLLGAFAGGQIAGQAFSIPVL